MPPERRQHPAIGGQQRRSTGWIILALALALPGCITLALGSLPLLHELTWLGVHTAALIHYGLIWWLLAGLCLLVGFAATRRPVLALLVVPVVVALLVQGWWWWPIAQAPRTAHSRSLTVAMINSDIGRSDAATIAALDHPEAPVDVFVIVEATAGHVVRLDAQGLAESHPYHVGDIDSGGKGTVLLSRHPVTMVAEADTEMQSLVARVQTSMGPVLVAGVHPVNPLGGARYWREDAGALRTTLGQHLAEPMVAIGDYNAIDRHSTMIRLTQDGFTNCADLTGQATPRTWPANSTVPPLVGIDHALVTPALTCTGLRAFDAPQGDHRGLIVDVALSEPGPG